ncbi:glutamate receptor ionotropic, NMDA 3A-like [Physella acuta]|uniref:glutamate receptor ionotropic, NMDA 3A-like n=1 Tax=Physella acuta TaxID=109671 RepID=UPI0027DD0CBF|nr:glutamate receptor ionotropic, NMDA 3A-like [Physella acuta]
MATIIHNPLFLSLQPSNKHLARGLVNLLAVNFWYRLTMVTQEELRYDGFYRTFRDLTIDGKWTVEDEIFISNTISEEALNNSLESLCRNSSRIFVLHATAALARRIFISAKHVFSHLNLLAWIITENAYTRNEDLLRDFPLGTKAFLVNTDVRADELLRDVLEFTAQAFQGNDRGDSPLISRMLSSSSSSSSSYRQSPTLSPFSTTPPSAGKERAMGCWSAKPGPVYPSQNDVYSALLSTSIYGLTGQLSFDNDGFMNISKFRMRNLVFDGRQSVWQDIGCVHGKDVRPFGIIWPGDAQSMQTDTDGRKRYRVVTNPVQPFVMTEAPHPDYGTCLSDTLCLNLTNKVKDKDVVLEAIRAFEEGNSSKQHLYTVQCCRGLSIDLLNKLASDLDFDFTLYIVQDETYGRMNESWDGMIRDLIDNTAHFAVAAFSITSQRERAIDFTEPYFFSGFSIIYSDRTRETSMLAFLEPFSTRVWFAILVSAHITAVCMALFEWNSPFGLNPWGRKRTKNYSLASGLTMVFSVLFGHTVKTKSPKAWPSKVMQNFWAFAAIFIIASYTANLAAFIAGKHAGINYMDIYDPRLQDIRIGVLQGSAVHGALKNISSKLVPVAERYYVPKTDEGVDRVM